MGSADRIALLGGTGDLGRGLALRLCADHQVIIGSRDLERARAFAEEYSSASGCSISGDLNARAASGSSFIVLAVPAAALDRTLAEIAGQIGRASTIVSPVVPMARRGGLFVYEPIDFGGTRLSAAEYIGARLSGSAIVSAFHTLPAKLLSDPGRRLDYDVLVAASDRQAFDAFSIAFNMKGVRYLYAGPLSTSSGIESLVPLLLNVGSNNKIKYPSLKVV